MALGRVVLVVCLVCVIVAGVWAGDASPRKGRRFEDSANDGAAEVGAFDQQGEIIDTAGGGTVADEFGELDGPADGTDQKSDSTDSNRADSEETGGFSEAFTQSLMMIFVTEIGDKTFFIAAVMSMRQGRTPVLIGALGALWAMTVLSVLMGFKLPQLISKHLTHLAASLLFLYFGLKLLYDASKMNPEGHSDDLDEVERQFETNPDVEFGDTLFSDDPLDPHPVRAVVQKPAWASVVRNAFVLTFLAEWGDRSQIATIALAVSEDPFGVTVGGALGHLVCTGIAVQGGKMLASRISERTVAFVGGILFIAFAIHEYMWG